MNKQQLHNRLTELMAITVESLEQQLDGKYPPYQHKWKERYQGVQNLPPHMVELNTFKMTVDHITSMIMMVVEEELTKADTDQSRIS